MWLAVLTPNETHLLLMWWQVNYSSVQLFNTNTLFSFVYNGTWNSLSSQAFPDIRNHCAGMKSEKLWISGKAWESRLTWTGRLGFTISFSQKWREIDMQRQCSTCYSYMLEMHIPTYSIQSESAYKAWYSFMTTETEFTEITWHFSDDLSILESLGLEKDTKTLKNVVISTTFWTECCVWLYSIVKVEWNNSISHSVGRFSL